MTNSYKLANEGIIWEKIGDQVVMANLESGRYCTIHELSGILVWELIIKGLSSTLVHQTLSTYFDSYDKSAQEKINNFLSQLIEKEFITIDQNPSEAVHPNGSPLCDKNSCRTFIAPRLITCDDIDSLLLLDPIDDYIDELMTEYEN